MRKKLLKEGTVRKFMKLANIGALSDSFVNEMGYEYKRDEEDLEEAIGGDLPEDEELEDSGPPTDELALDDEVPEAPEAGPEDEALLKRVVQAVADELGVEVEVEGEAEPDGLELEPEVGEADEELAPVGDDNDGMLDDEEDLMAEAIEVLLNQAGIEIVDDKKITEDLVKKVSGRVARRLLKEFL